jgi:hypothetical protein
VALGIVLGLATYLYRNAFNGYFLQDDFGWLYESRFATFKDYLSCFFRFSNALAYRPLSQETFFLLGQKAFGLQPFGYHLASFTFHLAGAGVLYVLVRQFAGAGASLAGTLFYVVHAAHSRSIGWISAVPEPMALLFYLLSVLFFVRFDRERRGRHLVLSVLAMLLGVASKESILTVPLVLSAYCLALSPRRLPAVLPHFLLTGGYVLARATSRAVDAAPYPLTFGAEAVRNLLSYLSWAAGFTDSLLLEKLHWEAGRSHPWVAVVLLAVMGAAVLFGRDRRVAVFAATWFVLALQPVLYFSRHIFPYYLAPSLAGLSLLLANLLEGLSLRRRALSIAAGAGLVGLSLWACRAIVRVEVNWWNEYSRTAQTILEKMPDLEARVPPGKQAYIFGFGRDEFGSMMQDAAIKAFGHSAVRFILIGLDPETPRQIRDLHRSDGLGDYSCFVYSKGDFADWTGTFRKDPEAFLLLRPADFLETLYREGYEQSPVRLSSSADSVVAGRDTLELQLTNLEAPAVDVLYTLDDRLMPAVVRWAFAPDGVLRVAVGLDTPRGRYHYRAVRDSRAAGLEGWIPVNYIVSVR